MSTDPSSPPLPFILPLVRQVVVCRSIHFDDEVGAWVVTGPLSVQFLPSGERFPFREPQVAVYTQVVGGLGVMQLGVEIRQRIDRPDAAEVEYRVVGSSLATDVYVFPGRVNRLAVYEVAFQFTHLPFELEGTYEFRIVALTAEGERPLDGGERVITYLAADGGASDA